MVAMKVGDKYARNTRRGNIGKDELPLRSLTGIEKQPFVVPADEIGSLVSKSRGLLA